MRHQAMPTPAEPHIKVGASDIVRCRARRLDSTRGPCGVQRLVDSRDRHHRWRADPTEIHSEPPLDHSRQAFPEFGRSHFDRSHKGIVESDVELSHLAIMIALAVLAR